MSESSGLDCSVLVLNRFYMPIRVVDVRRAMTLMYRGCTKQSPSKMTSTAAMTSKAGAKFLSSTPSRNKRAKIFCELLAKVADLPHRSPRFL